MATPRDPEFPGQPAILGSETEMRVTPGYKPIVLTFDGLPVKEQREWIEAYVANLRKENPGIPIILVPPGLRVDHAVAAGTEEVNVGELAAKLYLASKGSVGYRSFAESLLRTYVITRRRES